MPAERLEAERPNHVWALDHQHDATSDGRGLKVLNIVDEFTREALAIEVGRSINAKQTGRSFDASPPDAARSPRSAATTDPS